MVYTKKLLNKRAIGEKIRQAMLCCHITYEDLAYNLELNSPRVIYDWVNGVKLPSLENLINICLMFNNKVEDFIVLL